MTDEQFEKLLWEIHFLGRGDSSGPKGLEALTMVVGDLHGGTTVSGSLQSLAERFTQSMGHSSDDYDSVAGGLRMIATSLDGVAEAIRDHANAMSK